MTITLTPDLEMAVVQKALDEGTTPEAVVLGAIRETLGLSKAKLTTIVEPRDEWERRLLSVATPCGISVSDKSA